MESGSLAKVFAKTRSHQKHLVHVWWHYLKELKDFLGQSWRQCLVEWNDRIPTWCAGHVNQDPCYAVVLQTGVVEN